MVQLIEIIVLFLGIIDHMLMQILRIIQSSNQLMVYLCKPVWTEWDQMLD